MASRSRKSKIQTRATLENAYGSFIRRYGLARNNRLLFYFAGHGATLEQAYGGEMGYIVPTDAPLPGRRS